MAEKKLHAVAGETKANAIANNINRKSLNRVRAQLVGVKKAVEHDGKSKAAPEDPFIALIHKGQVIEPPFDLLALSMLEENNTELEPCLAAMEINIEGFGHRFVPRIKSALPGGKKPPASLVTKLQEEKIELENFFMYATRESFVQFRRKLRRDLESTGNAYFEVIRSNNGEIQGFTHLPSYQMRLGRLDQNLIKTSRPILALQKDGSVKVDTMNEWRRFRSYVQSSSMRHASLEIIQGYDLRWFKEFGDERIWDNTTGEIATESLAESKRANELIHLSIYSTRSPYGLPRYIGNLLSIYGDRAAEEINYITFRNNNIPSMVISVSNGQLTQGSIDRVSEFVESQIQDGDNYSKFLILEAEGEMEGEDGANIKLDIKPLVSEQHKDALFTNYSEKNQDKIRRVWRLPPIMVGRADEYTRATAEASRQLADEQIFAPERNEFDELFNRILFPAMGIRYHKFKSNSPNTTDNTLLVKILAQAEKTGGVTPRIARMLLEDILGTELPEFPEDFQLDIPFSLLMAEAVKNKAEPNEPGQQVTALKALHGELGNELFVNYLVDLNKQMEEKWVDKVAEEDCSCSQ
jgi:PBSX family phage portal protein